MHQYPPARNFALKRSILHKLLSIGGSVCSRAVWLDLWHSPFVMAVSEQQVQNGARFALGVDPSQRQGIRVVSFDYSPLEESFLPK